MTARPDPLVLMYHGVGRRPSRADPYNLFVRPEVLRAQLSWLLGRGWHPLRLADYLAGRAGPRSFLVTFDDGYRSVSDAAVPLLDALGVPATVFVLPGLLGGPARWMPERYGEPLMTARDVLAARDAGVDIGLHGLDHVSLAGLPPAELDRQIRVSAELFTDLLGEQPRAFAYPYGHHDAAARAAVSASGVDVAFATHRGAGPMAVSRVDVNAADSGATFRLKTLRAYPLLRRLGGVVPGLRPQVRTLLGGARRDG